MTTIFRTPIDLEYYLDTEIKEEVLLGRGYFHCKDGKVVSTPYTNFPDFAIKPYEPAEVKYEAMCKTTQDKIASFIEDECDDCWVTCLPADQEEYPGENYYLLFLTFEEDNGKKVISSLMSALRQVRNVLGLMIDIPDNGNSTIESKIFEMDYGPIAIQNELDYLIDREYIKDGFSLIGKKMPKRKDRFNCNPPYSIAQNSAYRNAYWQISLDVNDDNVIEAVRFSTFKAKYGITLTPESMTNDILDAHKALLYIYSFYSEEEREQLNK